MEKVLKYGSYKPVNTVDTLYETLSNHLMDSGERQSFDSGAVRDTQTGKGRFDLIEPTLLFRLSRVYELGAEKYDERNWEKGIPASRCLSSALRHLFKYLAGDRQEDHLACAVFNIAAIMRFEKDCRKDLLDLPRYDEEV